jgi:hypothetical protein
MCACIFIGNIVSPIRFGVHLLGMKNALFYIRNTTELNAVNAVVD